MTLPVKTTGRERLRRFRKRLAHEVFHVGWTLLKIIVALIAFLWLIGLPGSWFVNRMTSNEDPFTLGIRRVTWNPMRGIIAHRVTIHARDASRPATLVAAEVCIKPDYQKLWQRDYHVQSIDVAHGKLEVTLPADGLYEADELSLSEIDATIAFGDVTSMSGYLKAGRDINMHLLGDVKAPPSTTAAPSPMKQLDLTMDQIRASPEIVREILLRLDELEEPSATMAILRFHAEPTNPSNTVVRFEWQPRDLRYRGYAISAGLIELGYSNQTFSIDRIQLESNGRTLLAEGTYLLTNDTITARIYGDLSPETIAANLPQRLRDMVDRSGLKWEGTLHAEGWIGPCPIAEATKNWSAWLTLEEGALNDVPIERFFTSVKRTPEELHVDEGIFEGGSGPGRGAIRFDAKHDVAKQQLDGTLDINMELDQLSAVLPPGLHDVASMFTINDAPVRFTGTFSMPTDDSDQLHVQGDISGTNFSFRSVPLTGADIHLVYSNNVVTLDPFIASTATGGVRGSLVLDFNTEIYDIDLDVSANPHRVAPMAGKHFATYFDPYLFSDDILIRVQGRVDVAKDDLTDLFINASGRRIGYQKLMSDHLLMQAHRTPGRLHITNIVASMAQGTITGNVIITHLPKKDLYELDLFATNIALDALGTMFNPDSSNKYEGALSGHVQLKGPFPDRPGWTEMSGTGRVMIENGRLLLIPVFGGLSTLLEKIYPGLGFSEQNFAESSLEFMDGKIVMEDLTITGNLVSLAANGSYDWSNQLNYDVIVQPFRGGAIASAVRVVTMPISKLLEFKVTGSLTNPVWNAANLPLM